MYVYSVENLPIFVGFSYSMRGKRLKEVKICREILL